MWHKELASCTAAAIGIKVDVFENISARILLGTLSVLGGSKMRWDEKSHARTENKQQITLLQCLCLLSLQEELADVSAKKGEVLFHS